jgi:peptidoglycan/xylan/chitin deacetylase (PgdA/CDA1 family)
MTGSAILTYHSLDPSGSVISVRPEVFRSHIQSLADSGIPVVPLGSIQDSPGSVAITFDDGFRNLAEHAFPLLDRLCMPATVFVVSRYAGARNNWPSQPSSDVPRLPLLDWRELGNMPSRVIVGAHTATHPHLTSLPASSSAAEVRESAEEIMGHTGRWPAAFAYPYGSLSRSVASIAAKYFDLAVGTELGFVVRSSDRFALPRLDMFYFRNTASLAGLFSAGSRAYVGLRSAARAARSRIALSQRSAASGARPV